jgi:hypothetical protein
MFVQLVAEMVLVFKPCCAVCLGGEEARHAVFGEDSVLISLEVGHGVLVPPLDGGCDDSG